MSKSVQLERKIEESFPAPKFRDYQKEVVLETVRGFMEEGKDVVVIDAPTGFGKSIVLYTIADVLPGKTFYSTPQKALQEQLTNDSFVGDDVVEIMGRNNYNCLIEDTTVDRGPCQKDSTFDKEEHEECRRCPYYTQKEEAIEHGKAVMNTSYLMAEGMVDPMADNSFGRRKNNILDEVQSLTDWALTFVSWKINKFSIPENIYKNVDLPSEDDCDDMDNIIEWLESELMPVVEKTINELEDIGVISDGELSELEKLNEFKGRVDRFLEDVEDNEWVVKYDYKVRKNKDNYESIECEPLRVGRFLDSLVWNRADRHILSSATVPGGNWINEIGLGNRDVKYISVPGIFPKENRPIIAHPDAGFPDINLGKMTYQEREGNMLDCVRMVGEISKHHDGEKGLIHCRSYGLRDMFVRSANNNGYSDWINENVQLQNKKDREGSLEEWKNNDKQVFLSVNMSEGIDLEGELCEWQCLLKVLYPYMDKRVKRRQEVDPNEKFWNWYNTRAVTQIEQAYGRAVRSPDDEAVFYILDQSMIGLMNRNAELFHKWFLEAVEDAPVNPDRGR